MWPVDLQSLMIALISAVVGGGGAAAWLRAGGQNRTDYLDRVQARLGQIEVRTDEQDKHINLLMVQNADLHHQIGRLEGERAALERNIVDVRELARTLTGRVGELAQRVVDETKERARAIHDEQVQRARADFLQRETIALRVEIVRLQHLLPKRMDALVTSEADIPLTVKE